MHGVNNLDARRVVNTPFLFSSITEKRGYSVEVNKFSKKYYLNFSIFLGHQNDPSLIIFG